MNDVVKKAGLIFALGLATYVWWRVVNRIRDEMRSEGMNV